MQIKQQLTQDRLDIVASITSYCAMQSSHSISEGSISLQVAALVLDIACRISLERKLT